MHHFNKFTLQIAGKEMFEVEDFSINDREIIGLIGPNGSGKSTFLKYILKEYSIMIPIAYIEQLSQTNNSSISGGEQSLKNFQNAIKQNPVLLLADEPDNHLDIQTRSYLIQQLKSFQGAVILVSHNREILNQTCDSIWSIENNKILKYKGNYDDFEAEQLRKEKTHLRIYNQGEQEKKRLKKAIEQEQKKSSSTRKTPKRMGNSEARLHRMGNQRSKANLDKAAQRMSTRLANLDIAERPKENRSMFITLPETLIIYQSDVLYSSGFSMKNNGKPLLHSAKFSLKTKEKTALLGKNGSGKTTLLKQISDFDNQISFAKNIKIGYLSQFASLLDMKKTVLENILRTSIYDEKITKNILANLLFCGEGVYKKACVLSGGERTRLGLGMLMVGNYNLLLLDEITNHMDLLSIKAIEVALSNYDGTVLFTTHDRFFIESVADACWEIKNQKIIESHI